jgi:hypothetical protein
MKTILILSGILGLVVTSGCHAHKADKAHSIDTVVVKKAHHHNKVILLDNDHRRKDYRIVHIKPGRKSVCKKHKKHWHCI